MNTKIMIYDPHKPVFLRFKDSPQKKMKEEKVFSINYRLWTKRVFTLTLVLAFFYLLSFVLTENVLKFFGVILGLAIVHCLIRFILKITLSLIYIGIGLMILSAFF